MAHEVDQTRRQYVEITCLYSQLLELMPWTTALSNECTSLEKVFYWFYSMKENQYERLKLKEF